MALVLITPRYNEWQLPLLLLLMAYLGWQQWHRSPPRIAPFTVDAQGQGRRLQDGCVFSLSRRCRLLPQLLLLHSETLGWQWLWQDSVDDASWRRLCRVALQVQRGDNIVGAGSDVNSG
nr:protein YgfX [uncultured Ferrimonas sp.]